MARSSIEVDSWTYEGADAHRTLLHLGDLWQHHAHRRGPTPHVQQTSAATLAELFAPLAGTDDATLAPHDRVSMLGKRSADRIDELDHRLLQRALRGMWEPLAALAYNGSAGKQASGDAASTSTGSATTGTVAGLFLSDGGVPKTAIDTATIGFRGIVGDRQASRAHHGRPWQALCLWSSEVVADLALAGHPIRAGSAGENVSVSGLDWSTMRPGLRLVLGNATIVLTAYAIPCHKNARWFTDGDYERMSHERGDASRVYALVEQPGQVSVGDRLAVAQ